MNTLLDFSKQLPLHPTQRSFQHVLDLKPVSPVAPEQWFYHVRTGLSVRLASEGQSQSQLQMRQIFSLLNTAYICTV